MREKIDYTFSIVDELTKTDIEMCQKQKKLCRYFMEYNPEKKVIEIRPGSGGCIQLHGAQDAKNFIESIQNFLWWIQYCSTMNPL